MLHLGEWVSLVPRNLNIGVSGVLTEHGADIEGMPHGALFYSVANVI